MHPLTTLWHKAFNTHMYKKVAIIFLLEWLLLGVILATRLYTYSIFQSVFQTIQHYVTNSTLASFAMLFWLTLPQCILLGSIVYLRRSRPIIFFALHGAWLVVSQIIFTTVISK